VSSKELRRMRVDASAYFFSVLCLAFCIDSIICCCYPACMHSRGKAVPLICMFVCLSVRKNIKKYLKQVS